MHKPLSFVGGVATVTVVKQNDGRKLARKQLHPHLNESEQAVQQFCREADYLLTLSHPNLVQGFSLAKQQDGVWFFDEQFIDGLSLAQLVGYAAQIKETVPRPIVVNIIAGLLNALQFLHNHDIVHLDICHENILVGFDGITRLCDLGLSRKLGTEVISTPPRAAYAAPELLETGHYSPLTDIFSTGVVLWESLREQRLYREPQEITSMNRITMLDAPSVDSTWRNKSFSDLTPYAHLVANMLSRDANNRTPSAEKARDQLINICPPASPQAVGEYAKFLVLDGLFFRNYSRRKPFTSTKYSRAASSGEP